MAFDRGHALVIGIGTYQFVPSLNVSQTAQDSEAIAAVLCNPNYCGYPAQQVTVLNNSTATRDGILDALDHLIEHTSPDDTLMLFYSGHGEYGADQHYYLTTHDTQLQNRKVVEGTGIRETELLEKLRALPSKRAMLIFNACHSGALSPDTLSGAELAIDEQAGSAIPDALTTALLATGEGRIIIAACREHQKSYYSRNENMTLFAQVLMEGLQGHGFDGRRGYVSVFDLYSYVFDTVSTTAKRRWGRTQEPELTVHKGIGAMAIALYRGQVANDELGRADRPTTLSGVIHEVASAESKLMLQQILDKGIGLAAGRDIRNNVFIGGSQTNIGGNQTNIGHDQVNYYGSVNQRTVNTEGGDYAEGNIDKRQGAFVSGGTVYGPVVGQNSGAITATYGNPGNPLSRKSIILEDAHHQVQLAAKQAQEAGDQDLAEDLRSIVTTLEAALRAQTNNDGVRRESKLRQAQQDLKELANQHPNLTLLVQKVYQVQ